MSRLLDTFGDWRLERGKSKYTTEYREGFSRESRRYERALKELKEQGVDIYSHRGVGQPHTFLEDVTQQVETLLKRARMYAFPIIESSYGWTLLGERDGILHAFEVVYGTDRMVTNSQPELENDVYDLTISFPLRDSLQDDF